MTGKVHTLSLLLLGLLSLGACESQKSDSLDFPFDEDDEKSDVFGRSLIGRASPFEPDLSLSDPEVTEALNNNVERRRAVAWETVFKILEPVPLLGLQNVVDEQPEVELDVPKIPRFQTWYGVSDAKRTFRRLYEELGASGRRARVPPSAEAIEDAMLFNESALERSSRRPLDRYLSAVKALDSCGDNQSAEECAQQLGTNTAGAAAGISRILYSPGTITHMMSNYASVLDCVEGLETLSLDALPKSSDNFTECFSQEFPADAALIKAHWVRADFGEELPTYDTSAAALQERLSGSGSWESSDGKTDPSPTEIYTVRLRNGNKFRLAGLHIMTKETRHWQWITLWWHDKPDIDFGADRPQKIREQLPSLWSNYKMCAVSSFEEGDPELANRYRELPTLSAALVATGLSAGEPSWCSNPYLEHGRNNAKTNCIGCHQHGSSRVAHDLDNDGVLDPLDLEKIISNELLFPDVGRTQIRERFPADYLFSFNHVDDLSGMMVREAEFLDFTDKGSVRDRVETILLIEGEAASGAKNFAAVCAGCHGADGLGTSLGPSLAIRVPGRDDELLQSIMLGRGQIPDWETFFSDSDFADLKAYLRATF